MILTSVGKVAVALSLNAGRSHWGQQRCVCGQGRLTRAAETGRLCACGSGGARLLRRGPPWSLMRSRCRHPSGRGPGRCSWGGGGA